MRCALPHAFHLTRVSFVRAFAACLHVCLVFRTIWLPHRLIFVFLLSFQPYFEHILWSFFACRINTNSAFRITKRSVEIWTTYCTHQALNTYSSDFFYIFKFSWCEFFVGAGLEVSAMHNWEGIFVFFLFLHFSSVGKEKKSVCKNFEASINYTLLNASTECDSMVP